MCFQKQYREANMFCGCRTGMAMPSALFKASYVTRKTNRLKNSSRSRDIQWSSSASSHLKLWVVCFSKNSGTVRPQLSLHPVKLSVFPFSRLLSILKRIQSFTNSQDRQWLELTKQCFRKHLLLEEETISCLSILLTVWIVIYKWDIFKYWILKESSWGRNVCVLHSHWEQGRVQAVR